MFSLLILTISVGNNIHAESIKTENCFVDKNGNVVCESNIPSGCFFNEETLEIECPNETNDGKCELKPVC